MLRIRVTPLVLLSFSSLPALAQDSGIGYASVSAALEALRARKDVSIRVDQGWTVIEDRANASVWSFTPQGHPAYPAAIRRTLVERGGNVAIDMKVLCQAAKDPCDRLVAEFQAMNEKMGPSARKPAPAAQPSEIEVQPLGGDSFRLVLKSYRSRTIDAGQEELAPKAREACRGTNVGWGRYEFEQQQAVSAGASQPDTLILKQDISCGAIADRRPPVVSVRNRDPAWRPTQAQVGTVERQTQAYFTAKDAGRHGEAYALLSAGNKEMSPFEQWSARASSTSAKLGEARGRSIRRITWYKDPPQVTPGVYAAVDYSSQFANAEVHCGFVAWHTSGSDAFVLVREEENFIEKAQAQSMKPGELDRVRAQLGC